MDFKDAVHLGLSQDIIQAFILSRRDKESVTERLRGWVCNMQRFLFWKQISEYPYSGINNDSYK